MLLLSPAVPLHCVACGTRCSELSHLMLLKLGLPAKPQAPRGRDPMLAFSWAPGQFHAPVAHCGCPPSQGQSFLLCPGSQTYCLLEDMLQQLFPLSRIPKVPRFTPPTSTRGSLACPGISCTACKNTVLHRFPVLPLSDLSAAFGTVARSLLLETPSSHGIQEPPLLLGHLSAF